MDLRERAALLKESGEAFARAGDTERALLFHDAAIDLYLQAGDTDTAEALCETVVTLAPNGVRARCTLAWLAVLLASPDLIVRRIAQYAEAAVAAGAADRACRQLRCMAGECDDIAVLEVLADALLHLGDEPAANRVYSRIYSRAVPARIYENQADRQRVVAARLSLEVTV